MSFVGNPGLVCQACGKPCPRVAAVQKYCKPCSAERDRSRKQAWGAAHKKKADPAKTAVLRQHREGVRRRVSNASRGSASVAWAPADLNVNMAWTVRVRVPFSYALSKNALWSSAGGGGHVFMRDRARAAREAVIRVIRQAFQDNNIVPVEAKVYIDIFVSKPDHKGDAINVLDSIADGVKKAIGVDDRWFCVRGVDWEVVKTGDPVVIVGISQRETEPHRVCSTCGHVRPYTDFGKSRSTRNGISRECLPCRQEIGRIRTAERRERRGDKPHAVVSVRVLETSARGVG